MNDLMNDLMNNTNNSEINTFNKQWKSIFFN